MSHTTSILDLPNELLFHVKKFIPDADLRTHVCYYHTCARIAGLARIDHKDEQEDTVSWTDIAFDCIARDGFCDHPQCGGGLLERSAHQMKGAPACIEDDDYEDPQCHPLFGWVEFARCGQDTTEEGFLRSLHEGVTYAAEPSLSLARHPIATRSFATFFPLSEMFIFTIAGEDDPIVKRTSGVTVWDIQNMVQLVYVFMTIFA
ncbi:hypothetical protein B0H21DRAFT_819459 [Amylocystis lapponica]|nr:hypothetical protein B0H21DRAFT_819459 [Amylocystis lapponica]